MPILLVGPHVQVMQLLTVLCVDAEEIRPVRVPPPPIPEFEIHLGPPPDPTLCIYETISRRNFGRWGMDPPRKKGHPDMAPTALGRRRKRRKTKSQTKRPR